MADLFSYSPKRKQFGDPGYMIPEVAGLESTASNMGLDQQEELPAVAERPISQAMRDTFMNAPDPVEENARIALEGISGGPDQVEVPESLKPRSLKQNLKDALLGMVPVYGPVRSFTNDAKRRYDLALYKQQLDQEQSEFDVRKDAAMKWHDAQIKQQQELSSRQSKIKLGLMLYPNATPAQVMKMAGVAMPTAARINFENQKIKIFGKDGKTLSDWQPAVYNPTPSDEFPTGSWTTRDPETGESVTVPVGLVGDIQKPGTEGQQGDGALAQKLATLKAYGVAITPEVAMEAAGMGSQGGSVPLDRQQAELELAVLSGTATPEQKMQLEAVKRSRLTVPGFTSGAATDRSMISQMGSLRRNFMNSQIVKRYNWVADAVNFASKIDPNSQSAADHQALIYQFAKAMDPESVVREGEYKTVQKYSQAWKQQFGLDLQRIVDNKGLLAPDAIAKLQKTMIDRYNSTKQEYVNFRSEMGRIMDESSGSLGNEATLPDYGAAYPGLGGNPNLRVQKHKKTGKIQYSLDGGKTWRAGNPPQ